MKLKKINFPLFGFQNGRKIGIFGFPYYNAPSFKKIEGGIDSLRKTSYYGLETFSFKYKIDFYDFIDGHDYGNYEINKLEDLEKLNLPKHEKYIFLCGEHIVTSFLFKNFCRDHKLIWFDAHFDLREEFEGNKYSHACALKRILDYYNAENILIIGARSLSIEEAEYLKKYKFQYITVDEIKNRKKSVIKKIQNFCKNTKIYVSFDVDVLDPIYVPAVGTPEFFGLNLNDVFFCLNSIKNIEIIDFVEFGDDTQKITSTCIATIIREIIFKWCLEHENI